jgi:hypothetical protein
MVPLLREINMNSQKNHEENNESGKRSKILIYMINMVYFALSILLLVVGISYLTVFGTEYPLTRFSTTMCGAVFIVVGTFVGLLSILNVVFMNANRQTLVFVASVVIFILFIGLLAIGIWGCVVNSDQDSLSEEIRWDLMQTMRYYEERSYERYETRKITYLQTKYNCCGLQSYSDWRAFYLYGGQVFAVSYIDQWTVNNNLPYVDYVPDSCCINKQPGCGKQFYNNLNPTSFDRERIINTRGCISQYMIYLNKDIQFLSIFLVVISSVAIVLWAVLVFVYVSLHMKYR